MRLFNIILMMTLIGACTNSTDSSEEMVDTTTATTADSATTSDTASDTEPDTTSDSTEETEDVLVIDAVVVEPTDTAEEE